MDSVVMATNNYADVQEVEKDDREGRAGTIRGLGGSLTSAWWRSSCDKSQGSGRGGPSFVQWQMKVRAKPQRDMSEIKAHVWGYSWLFSLWCPCSLRGGISEHFLVSPWAPQRHFSHIPKASSCAREEETLPTFKSCSVRLQTDKTLWFRLCLRSLEGHRVIYIGQIREEFCHCWRTTDC